MMVKNLSSLVPFLSLGNLSYVRLAEQIPLALASPASCSPDNFRVPPEHSCGMTASWVPPSLFLISSIPRWFFQTTSSPFYLAKFRDYEDTYIARTDAPTDAFLTRRPFQRDPPRGFGAPDASTFGFWERLPDDVAKFNHSANHEEFINNIVYIIAYGNDTHGAPWAVIYEDPLNAAPFITLPTALDVLSGVKLELFIIKASLLASNCPALTQQVNALGKMQYDHERDGNPVFVCNETCQTNGVPSFP